MFWCTFLYTHISIFFLYYYLLITSRKVGVMSISYPTGFSEPSKCSRHKKDAQWVFVGRRKGRRKRGREEGKEEGREGRRGQEREEGRKKGREGGRQQLLTLHLLVCSRVELAGFRKPPSPAPLWQALCSLMVPLEIKMSQHAFTWSKNKFLYLFLICRCKDTHFERSFYHLGSGKNDKIHLVFPCTTPTFGRVKVHNIRKSDLPLVLPV